MELSDDCLFICDWRARNDFSNFLYLLNLREMWMKKRILIVDDESDIRDSLAELLSEAGYDTISATSAKSAFAMLSSDSVDLVLTDIRMPEVNGFALKRMIKESETFKHIPVIFMSGYSPDIDKAPSLVMTKPFNFDDLLSVIELTLMPETLS